MPEHPDRVLPLQGASNFRDLGGYPGEGGRPLRWRRLFRSDHLGGLTEADQQLLAGLGVSRAFDFRGVHERAAVPYSLPGLVRCPSSPPWCRPCRPWWHVARRSRCRWWWS